MSRRKRNWPFVMTCRNPGSGGYLYGLTLPSNPTP